VAVCEADDRVCSAVADGEAVRLVLASAEHGKTTVAP